MKIRIRRGAVCALGLALSAAGVCVRAAPTGGAVAVGSGSISQNGGGTTITQTSQNLAINWASFGIAAGERVAFVQAGAGAIALNRVLGSEVSRIDGSLTANGQVWILNPNGVLFGAGAQVSVGGLVASTLGLSDADFMAGSRSFSAGGNQGSVINQGSLTGGYVALLGKQVSNEGTVITANGTTALAAGDKVTLSFSGNQLLSVLVDGGTLNALAQNKGLIRADNGSVILTATAKDALLGTVVNNEGVIEAKGIDASSGTIKLLGGMNGGTVRVGGTLDASASGSRKGGFVETSGAHVKVADSARIDTRSQGGQTGTWLIDPSDFTIAASGGDITGQTLGNQLASTDVSIASSAGGTAGAGDIHVNDAVSWSSDSRLTLNAVNNININAAITATGNSAGLVLNHGDYANTGSVAAGTDYNVKAPITLSGAHASLAINGTDYTLIRDVAGLQAMSGDLNGHYALAGNIDASATAGWNSGEGFIPVGDYSIPFRGSLHGLGHTVAGLTLDSSLTYVALFGSTSGSTLRDFGLIDGSVRATKDDLAYVANLVGAAINTTIDNVFATSDVATNTRNAYVGGLVAELDGGSLRNSYATGNVSGTGTNSYVGGLAGVVYLNSTVSSAYATGDVNGTGYGTQAGGLIGYAYASTVGDVHATGRVTGNSISGGLVGSSDGTTISNAYATGDVAGGEGVRNGGLIGVSLGTTINNAYATGAVVGSQRSANGGLIGYADEGTVISNAYATGKVTAYGDETTNGGLIGYAYEARVDNVYATGAVEGNGSEGTSGGLIGTSYGGRIGSAYAVGNVSGGAYAGGLVGHSDQTVLSNVYASGDVSGGDFGGGLVGNASRSTVNDAYASGSVFAGNYAGGLIGVNALGTINRSYASGTVSGDLTVGGLVGYNVAAGAGTGVITASFWLASNTNSGLGIGMDRGTVDTLTRGLSGSEAKSLDTYTAAGWDMGSSGGTSTAWRIYEGSTGPLLRSFLKPLTVTAADLTGKAYDGTVASGSTGYSLSDPSAVLLGSGLSYSTSSADIGSYRSADGTLRLSSGLYSTQQGYDISYVAGPLTIREAAGTDVPTMPSEPSPQASPPEASQPSTSPGVPVIAAPNTRLAEAQQIAQSDRPAQEPSRHAANGTLQFSVQDCGLRVAPGQACNASE
ncbi:MULTISPECIES: GLUG motif-containing protein [unclassified Variovorax]|uniref:two-partner secretion domain-containing protein n=1 Tax=unclassified Variovorax TaxID=663243 RepID=UPI003F47A718